MESKPNSAPGSQQGLHRAVLMLRVIATQGRRGMSFTDIAKASKLPHATLHRLLASLMYEGLVHLDRANRRYGLGHLLYELGLVALHSEYFADHAQSALQRLATLTGDTVYMSERVGNEALTTARIEGSFPLKTLTLHIGLRRPLGVGAGGLAILAALSPDEAERIIDFNAPSLPALGRFDSGFLREQVALARERGFGYLDNRATRGMAAVAVALYDPATEALAAISVAAIPSRMTLQNAEQLAPALHAEARNVEAAVREAETRDATARG